MQTHWFYTVWPFIGVGGAIVMVAILLLTDTFRGNTTVSRWRDPVWLAWLAVPLYWVHQFEEYSLPVLGFDYSIQEMICEKLGFPPYPDLPDSAGLLPGGEHRSHVVRGAASGLPLQAQRPHRPQLLGIALRQRTCAHRRGLAAGAYNTGLWSAAILFVPLSLWVIYACAIRGPYSGKVVGVAFAAGAVTHVLLFIGYGFFKAGVIGNAGLLVYAAVIGFTPIILAALGSRFFKPELLRPVPVRQATA